MDSFSLLITALGGPTAVARELELGTPSVQKMRERNSVHPKHFPAFVKLAEKRGLPGVTLESLARLSQQAAQTEAAAT
jgi:lipoate synthase